MPAAITGTVAWTATIGGDAAARIKCGGVDPTETYAYFSDCNANGAVYRLKLSDQTWTKLYPNSTVFVNSGHGLAVSPDGTRLWVVTGASGPTDFGYAFDLLADGSSASPSTAVVADLVYSPNKCHFDPATGYLFWANNQNSMQYYVPSASVGGSWTAGRYFHGVLWSSTHQAVGPWRPDPGRKILYSAVNCLLRLDRRSFHCEVLAGDGSGSAGSTGAALSTPTGAITCIDSDSDGRIYFVDSTNRVRRLEDGTINDVIGNASGRFIYLPTAGALLVCDGVNVVRKVT